VAFSCDAGILPATHFPSLCIRPAAKRSAGIIPEPRRGNPNINHAPAFCLYHDRGKVRLRRNDAGIVSAFSLLGVGAPPKRRRPFGNQAGACRLTPGGGPARPAAGILF